LNELRAHVDDPPSLRLRPCQDSSHALGLHDDRRFFHNPPSGYWSHSRPSSSRPVAFLPYRNEMGPVFHPSREPSVHAHTSRFWPGIVIRCSRFSVLSVGAHSPHCLKKNGTPAA